MNLFQRVAPFYVVVSFALAVVLLIVSDLRLLVSIFEFLVGGALTFIYFRTGKSSGKVANGDVYLKKILAQTEQVPAPTVTLPLTQASDKSKEKTDDDFAGAYEYMLKKDSGKA